ncbi:MAG: GspE/PulE family protein [Planctomycetota bacterium]
MERRTTRKLIGQILKERGLIEEGLIQEALQFQREKGGLLGEILVAMKAVTESDLNLALGIQAGLEVVDLDGVEIAPEAIAKLDGSTAAVFRVVPVWFDGKTLTLAMADPLNRSIIDDLQFMVGGSVKAVVADAEQVARTIRRLYGDAAGSSSVGKVLEEIRSAGVDSVDLEDREAMAHAPPVVKLLNYILLQAVRDRASDVHFEPFEDEFRVRYRVDGLLYELEPPPKALAVAVISRVKVMAGLDIAETRVPQDGRIEIAIGGRAVDLRVSTLPTMFGESCVLRVLDRSVVALDLEKLGFTERDLVTVRELIDLPHGIVLVTGPTGSGKTTTLYSMLNEANDIAVKIITTEDPVEYDLEGIVQIPINEEIGVSYARVLRTILRQDPDKILVGEIRDLETAKIAVESALTGHLVLSTLHTNDAPSAITRLIDLGVEPYLLCATLEAVVAQRLVRRICRECRSAYRPDDVVLAELELTRAQVGDKEFYFGKGCQACNYSGYRGRLALYEIMRITERIRETVLKGEPASRLRERAIEEGMNPLRESGLRLIYEGTTTVEEVVRETIVER